MRSTVAVVCTALVLILTGCSSMEVAPDWDYDVDFSSFKTFGWIQESGSSEGDQLPEHLDIRLRRVVDDVMTEKGFDRVPVQPMADLLVAYYISLKKELKVSNTSFGVTGYSYGYWPSYASTSVAKVREVEKGTMVIDIVDRKTKQLVWTCQLKGAVEKENPSGDRVQMVIEKMMKEFPPE